MIINMAIRLSDCLKGMSLRFDDTKSFCKESRFLEIPNILIGDSLLMPQFLQNMVIFLLGKLFLLNI